MINIGKLRAASASYYLSAVAQDRIGYYVGNGEAPGRWCGSLATDLDLDGDVGPEQFQRLLAGLHPGTGEVLLGSSGSSDRARSRDDESLARRVEGATGLDSAQVAAQLGVTERAVRQWLSAGDEVRHRLSNATGVLVRSSAEVDAAVAELAEVGDPYEAPASYLLGDAVPGRGRGGRRWAVTQDEVDRFRRARHVPQAQAGWDVVFRPPKSYSVLWAVGGPEVGGAIHAIHHEAVEHALAYLEDAAAAARTTTSVAGERQRVRVETSGFVGAAFDHRDSRAGDPLLHTHLVIANVTQRADGTWAALDPRGLYAHARAADGIYQATFRHLAERRLGLATEPVINGWADVQGVPREVIDAFSKRSADIEAELARIGAHSANARQAAALATREAKSHTDGEDLHARWRDEADALGFGIDEVAGCLGRTHGAELDARTCDVVLANLAGPHGLTATAAVFSRADVIAALATSVGAALPGPAIVELADQFCASERVVPISETRAGHRRTRILGLDDTWRTHLADATFTTPELAAIEADLLAWTADTSIAPTVATAVLDEIIETRPALTDEQATLVRAVCRSTDPIRVVVGYPGAGKTFAAEAMAEAFRVEGRPVLGCAITAEAADELGRQTGLGRRPGTLGCDTITRVLADLDHPEYGGLPHGAVVLVDEASTVPHRELHRLARHARAAGGALVLIGDPHQHGAVGPGSFFTWLARERPTGQLTANNRQRDAQERLANVEFRDGRVADSLARRDAAGRITRAATAAELYERIAADWYGDWQAGSRDPMIATRNTVREALADAARHHLVAAGELSGPEVTIHGRPFQVGDLIVTRSNNRLLRSAIDPTWFVKNGSRGRIAEIDEESGSLSIDFGGHDDALHRVEVPLRWAEQTDGDTPHIQYGYAVTDYGVQGRTLDTARAVLDDATTAAGAYVASTRGRHANHLYVVEGPQADRGLDADATHDIPGNVADRQLDHLASQLSAHEPEALIHEVDPRVSQAAALAATANLGELEARLAGVERRIAAGPPDVSRRLAGAERRHSDLLARRRVLLTHLDATATPPGELRLLDEQLGALDRRVEDLRVAERDRAEYARRHQQLFDRRDVLRAAVETRTASVRLHAPDLVRLDADGPCTAGRRDRWATRDAKEEIALYADRTGRRIDPDTPADHALGPRPDEPEARLSWERADAALQRVAPRTEPAPGAEIDLVATR